MKILNAIKLTAILAVVSGTLLGSGCGNRKTVQSISAEVTDNKEVVVELVLTHDGVKVYRFWDGWRYIYYTDARGTTRWEEVIPQGKTVRIEEHEVNNVK